jgi:sRNA-binding carbon storage regulator CsrA
MPKQPTMARNGFNIVEMRVGETIKLESVDFGEISVTINAKDGQRVRLGIRAGESVKVHRPARKTA